MMVSTIVFGILIFHNSESNHPLLHYFVAFFFSTALTIVSVLWFKKTGKITDLDASIREQRVEPLIYATIYHAVGFLILSYLGSPPIVKGLMFCYAVNTGVVWFITKYWKISIHAIGLGGPLTALWLVGYSYPVLMGALMVMVCLSRVILKAHTPAQVIAGSLLAIGLAYAELTYLFL